MTCSSEAVASQDGVAVHVPLTEELSPAFPTIEWCAHRADGESQACTVFDVSRIR